MNYPEALEFLTNLTKFGMNFGLARIQRLLELVGNPHQQLAVIHIGGTNGKGSVACIMASILRKSGFHTALFTSPHLHSYTERFLIDGIPISENELAGLLTELRPHLEAMVAEGNEQPTEFEVLTACAFLCFCRHQVDYAVIEVGLGGAIDSTNVVGPLVAVITNVAMDHMDYLGSTVEEIARVKAGIIKSGRPAVTASTDSRVLPILAAQAQAVGAELYQVQKHASWQIQGWTPREQTIDVQVDGQAYPGLRLPLLGEHQALNLATALVALRRLPIEVSPEAIYQGVREVRWPARLEFIPDPQGYSFLIDAAHNTSGAQSLGSALSKYFPRQRLIMVIGMLADKEREKVVGLLAPLGDAIIVTKPNSYRAGDWMRLAEMAKAEARSGTPVYTIADITQAVDRARALAGPGDLIVITGSFYMVADARAHVLKQRSELSALSAGF